MSWPNFNADGSLKPFTSDQLTAMGLAGATAQTADIRNGEHPTFRLDSQGCSINRAWFTPWAQRDNAIAALLGGVGLVGTFPNYTLSRVMPMTFPVSGYEQYIALALESVMGARSAGQNDPATLVPIYQDAKIQVRHEQVFWGLAADGVVPEHNRYVEQLPSTVETSYLSVPGSMMQFRNRFALKPQNGVLIPYNVGRPEVLTRISYKWHRLPYAAWRPESPLYKRVHGDPSNTTVVPVTGQPAGVGKVVGTPYIGCVSSADMLGYPSGYALFEGVEEEIVPDPVTGYPCWNLIYKFLIKCANGGEINTGGAMQGYGGHNYLYYGGQATDGYGTGYFLAIKGTTWLANGLIPDGVTLFPERNLLNLWNVGAVADADI